jgi:5-formyltetrahydrofolate cyclo-ligase
LPSPSAPHSKQTLRGIIKARLSTLPPEDFPAQGAAAAAKLRESPYWDRYETLLIFLSLPREIDTRPLLDAALGAGKKIFAPRVEASGGGVKSRGDLAFYRIFSSGGPWAPGPFGIREPGALAAPLAAADFPALVIVPGMAFDGQGGRLGRGSGYYDRFLAGLEGRDYRAIGLCMSCQLVAKVPVEKWDKKMDEICTGANTKIPPSWPVQIPLQFPRKVFWSKDLPPELPGRR